MLRYVSTLAAAAAAFVTAAEAASVSRGQPPAGLRSPPRAFAGGEGLANSSKEEEPWFGHTLQRVGAALSESPLSTGEALVRRLMGTPEGETGHLEASLLEMEREPPSHRRHRGAGRATANPQLAGRMFGGLPWIFLSPVVLGMCTVIIVHIVSLWSEFTHTGKAVGLPGEVDES
mmetsp:Transcript_18418/g.57993  ORF Transcript_18418/g.57993 Transcript_18418/m.57993 type:complete len:175 (+) Transcript_18418:127-651(+)